MEVPELLAFASLIGHKELAAVAGLVDSGLGRVGDEVEPAPRLVVPAGAHVPFVSPKNGRT